MKRNNCLLVAGAMALTGCLPAKAATQTPNIIWIVADDLGYNDLGCYGSREIPTPHIDSLAKDGCRLTDFYAYPTCTPTRSALLTGRLPETMGLNGPLMGHGGFPKGTVTIAQLLKESGYATGAVGKWHLGYDRGKAPNAMGFDRFFGHRGGKIDYYKHTDDAQPVKGDKMGKHDLWSDETEVFRDGEYTTDLFTAEAKAFIEKNKSNPFFLYLAYNAPHYARKHVLQAPPEYIAKFAKDPENPTMRETYIAMVSCMDDGIGEVLDLLKQLDLEQNTLVIFIGDNGGDPKHGASNYPLRGGKWTAFEGGIRVHCLARWPERIPAGAVSDALVHCTDLFTTSLSMAGVQVPETLNVNGLNAETVFTDKGSMSERAFVASSGRGSGVRKGDWKFVQEKTGRKTLGLFDLSKDREEKNNLKEQYPEKMQELMAIYNEWEAARKARRGKAPGNTTP